MNAQMLCAVSIAMIRYILKVDNNATDQTA